MINSSHTVKTWPDDNDIFDVLTYDEKWTRVTDRKEAEKLSRQHQRNGWWAQVVVVEIFEGGDEEEYIGLADLVENS